MLILIIKWGRAGQKVMTVLIRRENVDNYEWPLIHIHSKLVEKEHAQLSSVSLPTGSIQNKSYPLYSIGHVESKAPLAKVLC